MFKTVKRLLRCYHFATKKNARWRSSQLRKNVEQIFGLGKRCCRLCLSVCCFFQFCTALYKSYLNLCIPFAPLETYQFAKTSTHFRWGRFFLWSKIIIILFAHIFNEQHSSYQWRIFRLEKEARDDMNECLPSGALPKVAFILQQFWDVFSRFIGIFKIIVEVSLRHLKMFLL